MKVNLGPYLRWIGPYQIADMVFFWVEQYPEPLDKNNRWDYKLHDRFGEWLANTWVADFCQWIYDKRTRKVKIKIDDYDVWSLDHTLSLIILPALIKLKDQKHGYFFVDDKDVPKHLRSKNGTKESEHEWDSLAEARCDYVFDELIWTFSQLASDDHENTFFKFSGDKRMPWDEGYTGPEVDWDGLNAHNNRIKNGTMLFGKYFQNLWD